MADQEDFAVVDQYPGDSNSDVLHLNPSGTTDGCFFDFEGQGF